MSMSFWVSVDVYGSLSVPMGIYRYLWVSMGVCGFSGCLWIFMSVMGVYGYLWVSGGSRGIHGCIYVFIGVYGYL